MTQASSVEFPGIQSTERLPECNRQASPTQKVRGFERQKEMQFACNYDYLPGILVPFADFRGRKLRGIAIAFSSSKMVIERLHSTEVRREDCESTDRRSGNELDDISDVDAMGPPGIRRSISRQQGLPESTGDLLKDIERPGRHTPFKITVRECIESSVQEQVIEFMTDSENKRKRAGGVYDQLDVLYKKTALQPVQIHATSGLDQINGIVGKRSLLIRRIGPPL
ncbi:hypothetical protein QFC20_004849 [Naganishia adeliensis]|uniref:Uncharacterized protein n=1 Tax=Naganishia adeliensis TaxID=92952 RepID=A0ACC2VVA1_9TREE|nr:hypothetical protein QFC20_004849 [Naganishia adeliensis]